MAWPLAGTAAWRQALRALFSNADRKMQMHLAKTTAASTYRLDDQATPITFYRFLRAHPDEAHVTIEFQSLANKPRSLVPVIRIVDFGEREFFADDSRAGLSTKIQQWSGELLEQPGGSRVAQALNDLFGQGQLSIDVGEFLPSMAAMRDVYGRYKPNSHVQAWFQHIDEVNQKLIPDDMITSDEEKSNRQAATKCARELLCKFDDLNEARIGMMDLLNEAWLIAKDLGSREKRWISVVFYYLNQPATETEIAHIIGPEVKDLLFLCKNAPGSDRSAFMSNGQNQKAAQRILAHFPGSSVAQVNSPSSSTSTPPRSTRASPQVTLAASSDALNTPPKYGGSSEASTNVPARPVRRKTVMPKSPRGRTPPWDAAMKGRDTTTGLGAQTIREKGSDKVRPELRRAQTEEVKEAPQSPRVVARSQERLQSQAQRRTPEGRKDVKAATDGSSGISPSLKRSATDTAGQIEPAVSRSLPRTHRRSMTGNDAHAIPSASTASTTSTVTPSSQVGKERPVPVSRRQDRRSQPPSVGLQDLFGSPRFVKARAEQDS